MPTDIPIAHVDIRPEDVEAVGRVLASGSLRQGKVVAEFEEAVAERVGAEHAVAVSSGTAALHLAYLALFEPGDEVIVPAFTFVATASMVMAAGARPILADIDPKTLTINVDHVRSLVTERTRGIAGVHLFGNACAIDELTNLAREAELTIVWDAAQALGTEYNGKDIGCLDRAVCYSFYPTKNITTGEGGMIVTPDGALAEKLCLLRSQGAERKYLHTVLGFNYRLTDFQAALGISQLARLNDYLAQRRRNASALSESLGRITWLACPTTLPGVRHSYNQYAIVLSEHVDHGVRDQVAERLRDAGVETAVHYPRPLHHQPFMAQERADLSVSQRVSERVLCLPIHPGIDDSAALRLAETAYETLSAIKL